MSLRVALFKGTGFEDAFIRLDETGNPYTHAAFLLSDGTIIEAFPGVGVRQIAQTQEYLQNADLFSVAGLTSDIENDTIKFLKLQLGKSYSWRGDFEQVFGFADDGTNQWFCSKLVFEALRRSGLSLLSRISCGRVRPDILSFSPLLTP